MVIRRKKALTEPSLMAKREEAAPAPEAAPADDSSTSPEADA